VGSVTGVGGRYHQLSALHLPSLCYGSLNSQLYGRPHLLHQCLGWVPCEQVLVVGVEPAVGGDGGRSASGACLAGAVTGDCSVVEGSSVGCCAAPERAPHLLQLMLEVLCGLHLNWEEFVAVATVSSTAALASASPPPPHLKHTGHYSPAPTLPWEPRRNAPHRVCQPLRCIQGCPCT
jgi:hypothetical protein